jgi:tRNA threonylcarbamoyladenosine biosynthesis protein TsaB
MTKGQNSARPEQDAERLVLGIDTCGPSGSVALARLRQDEQGSGMELLGQIELAGKSYSATLVAAVGELLSQSQRHMGLLHAMVVTSGPGSFTGVRVGLSVAKGLAEPGDIPLVAVSRLAALAQKAGVDAAALDAHRREVFVRLLGDDGAKPREFLAGQADLEAIPTPPAKIAVCDEAATELLQVAWPRTELIQVDAPTAADAIELAAPQIWAGEFADPALLDGHYLRRSDAEIFGIPSHATNPRS